MKSLPLPENSLIKLRITNAVFKYLIFNSSRPYESRFKHLSMPWCKMKIQSKK